MLMNQLYDAGYQSVNQDLLFAALKRLGAALVDVRYSPHSQNRIWDISILKEKLRNDYVHIPELGNTNYKDSAIIRLASPEAGILMLYQLLVERSAIMICACYNRGWCHRAVVAKWFESKYGMSSIALSSSGLKAIAYKPEVEQLDLFEQPTLGE